MTWLVFVAVCLLVGVWFRWKIWVVIAGLAMSTFPFQTWPFEVWTKRTGRLISRNLSTQVRHTA
ncbi:DUF3817 domain-containing protein [Pseudoclavibacter sp. CFCC 11306]|nr:DUF3817 domain-containing protein [Pseudoclavibacter sp. CFCC 11306]